MKIKRFFVFPRVGLVASVLLAFLCAATARAWEPDDFVSADRNMRFLAGNLSKIEWTLESNRNVFSNLVSKALADHNLSWESATNLFERIMAAKAPPMPSGPLRSDERNRAERHYAFLIDRCRCVQALKPLGFRADQHDAYWLACLRCHKELETALRDLKRHHESWNDGFLRALESGSFDETRWRMDWNWFAIAENGLRQPRDALALVIEDWVSVFGFVPKFSRSEIEKLLLDSEIPDKNRKSILARIPEELGPDENVDGKPLSPFNKQ